MPMQLRCLSTSVKASRGTRYWSESSSASSSYLTLRSVVQVSLTRGQRGHVKGVTSADLTKSLSKAKGQNWVWIPCDVSSGSLIVIFNLTSMPSAQHWSWIEDILHLESRVQWPTSSIGMWHPVYDEEQDGMFRLAQLKPQLAQLPWLVGRWGKFPYTEDRIVTYYIYDNVSRKCGHWVCDRGRQMRQLLVKNSVYSFRYL